MARDPSKTENATPKQVNRARRKGNVPKSQEVNKAVSVLAAFIGLTVWIQYMGRELLGIFRYFFANATTFEVTDGNIVGLMRWMAVELAKITLPVMIIIAFLMILSIRLQVGQLWTTEIFKFKWNKFNLIAGLKRMLFSPDTLIRMGKSVLLAFFIGLAPWLVIKSEMLNVLALYHFSAQGIAAYMLTLASTMVKYALFPMVIIALADAWYTRWSYNENLKMTKSEVKDERKQAEGDEKIKAKIRQKMMKMSMRHIAKEVPRADVIITNPTHIAVALRYDPDEAPAPLVLAMGANHMAEKIKEIARENRIPIRENVPLARALYKQTEVGDTIPPELFQAVALILAQIWKHRPPKRKKNK